MQVIKNLYKLGLKLLPLEWDMSQRSQARELSLFN